MGIDILLSVASLPISFIDPQPEKKPASEGRLQLVPPRSPTSASVTVRLGAHLAEITAMNQPDSRRITYSYAIFTMTGDQIYQSGDGFLSAAGVVEKAAQHLEILWNSERC
ncbi:MAG: hypothetical protein ACXWCW_24630 [Burkholderiales bacterium]